MDTNAAPAGQSSDGEDPHLSRRTRQLLTKSTVMIAATAVAVGAVGVAVGADAFKPHHDTPAFDTAVPATSVGSARQAALSRTPASDAGIAARVLPSVVSINVTGSDESDTGSGVVLTATGYILTNNHVVAGASNGGSVSVTFADSSTARAKIIGTDPLDDLAVIKVAKSGLTPASLGDSSDLQVGDPVLAFGAPLGLSGTVTSGIVSALNRPVQTEADQQPEQQTLPDPFGSGLGNLFGLGGGASSSSSTSQPTVIDAIQTDAAINPGNSGGPLVDADAQVIGIDSAIASLGSDDTGSQSGNIGVGFAIPINEAKTIARELITTGHAQHPLLGVSLQDKTVNGTTEAVVRAVTPDGAAAIAGIKTGDIITAVGAVQTHGTEAVIAAVRSYAPGQHLAITVQRRGKPIVLHATLSNAAWTPT